MPSDSTPYGYCKCGCGQKTSIATSNHTKNGYKVGEPRRYLRGHNPSRSSKRDSRYQEDPKTGCWEWLGPRHLGYGMTNLDNRSISAHVYMYQKFVGEIPPGMQIDHLCRNRGRCNPSHLEAVTPAQNVQRGNCAKLNPDKIREIRKLAANGVRVPEISRSLGIHRETIRAVVSGRTWKNVQ